MSMLRDPQLERLRALAADPTLLGGRYRVEGTLGLGGMGAVYLAYDAVLERKFALKIVRATASGDQWQQRLAHEAQVLAKLEHPGIVPVHDLGRTVDGDIFYVMKSVEGRTFADYCRGPASLPERLRVLLRVCETAAFAHAHGVIHRDLTPGNVMVGAFGEVLILDWGMARRRDPRLGTYKSENGAAIGTPGYAAPEVRANGGAHLTPAADVFSLGGLVTLAVTGHEPQVANDASVVPGDWPPGRRLAPLLAVVRKALRLETASRYASVRDFGRDLERFLDQEKVQAYDEPWFEAVLRVLGKYRFVAALILAYIVLRFALAWWSHRG